MGRLLFFIFMPLVFEGIMLLFEIFKRQYFKGNKTRIIFFSVLTFIDYAIELIFLVSVYSISGEWLTKNSIVYNSSEVILEAFVTCAAIVIILAVVLSFTDILYDEIPIAHTLATIILFFFFCIFLLSTFSTELKKEIFENTEYELVEEKEVDLRALTDTITISGELNGYRHRSYIQGTLEENYSLSYAYVAENGETAIKTIEYNDDTVDIFEDGEGCRAYIKSTKYYKEYKDLRHEYSTYEIHIPSITTVVELDLQ